MQIAAPISTRVDRATTDPVATAIAAAAAEGVRFRWRGDDLEIAGRERLSGRDQRLIERLLPEITERLRGPDQGDPEVLLERLDIECELVTDMARAAEVIADLPAEIGLDIETQARAEHAIEPPWLVTTRDGRRAKRQPPAQSSAALDPLLGQPRLVSIYDPARRTTFVFDILALGGYPTGLLDRRVVVGHNLLFDLAFLAAQGIAPQSSIDTLQIAAMLLAPGTRGLDNVAAEFLGLAVPKTLASSAWGTPELSTAQIAYAGADPALALAAGQRMYAMLDAREVPAFKVANRAIRPIVQMRLRGLPFVVDAHRQVVDGWQLDFAAQRAEFRQITGVDAPTRDLDVRAWLLERLPDGALVTWKHTPRGVPSIEAAELKKHALDWPEVRPLLALRRAQKRIETFGEGLIRLVNPTTDRLHGDYHLPMITGRMSCSRPNLQNLPTDARDAVRAAEGKLLVTADLNQIELRIAAEDSGDPEMKAAFAAGDDLHARFTRTLLCPHYDELSKDEQALERKRGKAGHFGNLFAQSVPGFRKYAWKAFDLELTIDAAAEIQAAFYAMYPTIRDYQQEQFRQGRWGVLYSVAGRPRRASWEREGTMWLQLCANYRIQASAADVLLTALHRVDRALPGTLVAAVHDELVLEVDEDLAEQAAAVLVDEMTAAFATWFPHAPTAGLVEVKTVKAWSEAK